MNREVYWPQCALKETGKMPRLRRFGFAAAPGACRTGGPSRSGVAARGRVRGCKIAAWLLRLVFDTAALRPKKAAQDACNLVAQEEVGPLKKAGAGAKSPRAGSSFPPLPRPGKSRDGTATALHILRPLIAATARVYVSDGASTGKDAWLIKQRLARTPMG